MDPFVAHGSLIEEERRPDGRMERALTVFLAGAECPFTCSFCDLWQWTLDGPTPPGALIRQLEGVLATLDGSLPERIKIYNASNFFDRRAVPELDVAGIATLASSFASVTVESHANTIGAPAVEFAGMLRGRLEVAVGLESIDPVATEHLNKRLDLARFDSAARFLAANAIDLRVFVLLGTPFVRAEDAIASTVRAVAHAVDRGAAVVSIIPVRGGNGEMERLHALGHVVPPTLSQLETALDACLGFADTVVTADLWDVEELPACAHCRLARIERLRRLNATGRTEARVACSACEHE